MTSNNSQNTALNCLRAQEHAVQWFTLLSSGKCTEQDIADHKLWLQGNPLHKKEYDDLEDMWELLGSFADKPEILNECYHIKPPDLRRSRQGNVGLQQEITQLQQKSNRLQLLSAKLQHDAQKEPVPSRTASLPKYLNVTRYALVASMLVVILSFGLVFQSSWLKNTYNQLFNQDIYSTAIGEQKSFRLVDGSVLLLDTQTHVTVDYSDSLRSIILVSGQARFNVAKDKKRPFVVHAGNGLTSAIGTSFIVKKIDDNTQVTLIEGKVAVLQTMSSSQSDTYLREISNNITPSNQSALREVVLEQGQQVTYSPHELSTVTHVDLAKATSWEKGRLVFDDYSLREVLDELNRYSDKKIILGDNSLAELRVTGVFKSGDNRKAIQALKSYFSMQVSTDLQGNLILVQALDTMNDD